MRSATAPIPPPPASTGPPMLRPRASVTCVGSSLAPLRNRIGVPSFPRKCRLSPDDVVSGFHPLMRSPLRPCRPPCRSASQEAAPPLPRPPKRSRACSELVGQRLVVAINGTRPSAAVLRRARRGEIGGVILFGGNITGPEQLRRADRSAAGRRPAGWAAAAPDRNRPGGRRGAPARLGRAVELRLATRPYDRPCDPARGTARRARPASGRRQRRPRPGCGRPRAEVLPGS